MNRYRGLTVPPETGEQPISLHHAELDLGLRGELKARQLPEGASPELWDVRFERGGFRKDFGEKFLGQAAPAVILCIIEHKYISDEGPASPDTIGSGQFHRLIRLFRNADGVAETQLWDLANGIWRPDAIATGEFREIGERMVRGVSVQNVLLFAVPGAPIMYRDEDIGLVDGGNDFPSSTTLTAVGEFADVVLDSPGQVFRDEFRVNFNVTIELLSGEWASVTLVVELLDGTELGRKTFTNNTPNSLIGLVDQHIAFTHGLENGTTVRLRIDSIDSEGLAVDSVPFQELISDPPIQATEAIASLAYDEFYSFNWTAQYSAIGIEATWRMWRYDASADNWQPGNLITTVSSSQFHNHQNGDIFIPTAEVGDRFGLELVSVSHGGVGFDLTSVAWITGEGDVNVTVEPYNLVDDAAPKHGLTYQVVDSIIATLNSTEGPRALWIEPFADRVVALVDGHNTQSLWWTPSGNVLEWDPFVEGAGQIDLYDSRNDPIDDLQCAAPLSSDSLAIFRHRSIMRGFRTGQSIQAIGVNHWLENIGTESPFSRQVTPIGVIFLGHDRMVYVLTEGGIRPVGLPIHQILIERLTDNLDRVDSVFDPVFQHYYLGIPVFGSSTICEIYILDVARLMNEDKIVWRRRSCGDGLERFGIASEL